jgi:polyisoprenoid-binding protein YceI
MTVVFAGLLLIAATPARAELHEYRFDKAHTQILFFVDHLGFSKSQGEFHDYDGTIQFDRENPENSSVNVTIQTDSIDMDDEEWDNHMKNEDFFHVEEYPTMTFESTDIEVTGEKKGKITGDLTILGTTRDVTLDTTFNKAGKHPYSGNHVAGFSATTEIKRSDFGMKYGLPGIGDTVNIRLEVEAIRKGSSGEGMNK